jgi:ribonuclease HI
MASSQSAPFELPDRSLVCSYRKLVVCPNFRTDYSVVEEPYDPAEDPHVLGRIAVKPPGIVLGLWSRQDRSLQRGTGRVIAQKFAPQSSSSGSGVSPTPLELFPPTLGSKASPTVRRFINRHNDTQLLIYADGACVNNGRANPQAGYAFYFRPAAENTRDNRRNNMFVPFVFASVSKTSS